MSFICVVRPRADVDVDEIADYLAEQSSLDTALQFLGDFYRTLGLLREQPQVGWRSSIPRAARIEAGVFRVSEQFERCLIFYRVGEGRIEILRVLDGSRNLPVLFEREGIE